MEETHETDFRRALRIGAVVARAIENQSPRGARRSVDAESELVKQANRKRASAAGFQIKIKHLGLDLSSRGAQRR